MGNAFRNFMMARIFGLSGRITGRKGDAVFSVRKGEQIVRQYNPMVLNPNTEAQTVQRSKMKLSSQLGAIFANVIAIPGEGAKTSRNIFTKINFGLITRDTSVEGIKVQCDLPSLQLTKSGRAMIPFGAYRMAEGRGIMVSLLENASEIYDRVVYVVMTIYADGSIAYRQSEVVSTAGDNGRFALRLGDTTDNLLIYAYGIKDLSQNAKTMFQNTAYEEGTGVASLISGRVVSMSDAQVSMTAGIRFDSSDTCVTTNNSEVMVVLENNTTHCDVKCNGLYLIGADCVINVVPESGYVFSYWKAGSGENQETNPGIHVVSATESENYINAVCVTE